MMKYCWTILLLIIFSACKQGKEQSPNKVDTIIKEPASLKRFERMHDSLAGGTSLLRYFANKNTDAPVGDFLARLWYLYGKPEKTGYDGFEYTLRDPVNGLIFTAYSGSGGPAFGARTEDEAKVTLIVDEFEKILLQGELADCEIRFPTDFGTQISGAKDGVPFDKLTK